MQRAFANVLTDDFVGTVQFYEELLELKVTHNFGWFAVLGHPAMPKWEFGVLDKTHDTAPRSEASGGVILTFVVDDVEAVFDKAEALGVPIIAPPTDMPYGQRRLLIRDPAGTLLDISALIMP